MLSLLSVHFRTLLGSFAFAHSSQFILVLFSFMSIHLLFSFYILQKHIIAITFFDGILII